jgi:hypothetical protein
MGGLLPILFNTFTSNNYCARLATAHNLTWLCLGVRGINANLFRGKAMADLWEVSLPMSFDSLLMFLSSHPSGSD